MKRFNKIIEILAIIILVVSSVILTFYQTYYKVSILLWEILLILFALMKMFEWITQKRQDALDPIDIKVNTILGEKLKYKKRILTRFETIELVGSGVIMQFIIIIVWFELEIVWAILSILAIIQLFLLIRFMAQLSWSSSFMLAQAESNETIDEAIEEFGYKERFTYDFLYHEFWVSSIMFYYLYRLSWIDIIAGLWMLTMLLTILISFIRYARNKDAEKISRKNKDKTNPIINDGDIKPTNRINDPADVEVTFYFNGKRHHPMINGFRPAHRVKDDYLTTGIHRYFNKTMVLPDEIVRGTITFITPPYYPKCLWVGKEIEIIDGYTIGYAAIEKIMNPILDANSDVQ